MFIRALSGAGYSEGVSLSDPLNVSASAGSPQWPLSGPRSSFGNRLGRIKDGIADTFWTCPLDTISDEVNFNIKDGEMPAAPSPSGRRVGASCLKQRLRNFVGVKEPLLGKTVAKEENAFILSMPSLSSLPSLKPFRRSFPDRRREKELEEPLERTSDQTRDSPSARRIYPKGDEQLQQHESGRKISPPTTGRKTPSKQIRRTSNGFEVRRRIH